MMEDPAIAPYSREVRDEITALREEIEQLNAEIREASEERAQAAEYGLVVLEEKQALQAQYEELSTLYESTKREFETSVNSMKQVQTDYEKRLREVEAQREHLLEEMDTRETALITKVGKLDDQIRQYERKLRQCVSEQDHLSEHNSYLNGELDRYRREADVMKEESRRLRQEQSTTDKEKKDLQADLEKHEAKIKELRKFEEECSILLESNRALKCDTDELREQNETLEMEKEELQHQNRQALQALNEEMDAKSMLEAKLREESINRPSSPSWAEEKEAAVAMSVGTRNHSSFANDRYLATSSPTPISPNGHTHSTPFGSKKTPSLLSELQNSFMASMDSSEMETLRRRCKEADDSITALQKEKLSLEEKVASVSLQQTQATSEVEKVRDEYSRTLAERERVMESLKEDILIKEEMLGQLRNKLTLASAEKSSMKIEIDGLKDELERLQDFTSKEVEKVQKEYTDEQAKNEDLKNQNANLEDQITLLSRTVEKLEAVICSSHSELNAMNDEIRALHKTVATLGSNQRVAVRKSSSREFSPSSGRNSLNLDEEEAPVGVTLTRLSDAELPTSYSIKMKHGREEVRVHDETHSMLAIVQLHEHLRSVRSPLEQFTKIMLERSLAQSAKHIPSDQSQTGSEKSLSGGRHGSVDIDATVNKLKSMLSHKTEEVNNLRAIMKARATTADVATSSLRSKLEGQARTYQAELVRLKHHLKAMKKERDDHKSLQVMYSKRCDEYGEQITRLKQETDRVKEDNEELMVSLKKTIQRKLELSRELEEYRVEQERLHLIPKLLNSSRI